MAESIRESDRTTNFENLHEIFFVGRALNTVALACLGTAFVMATMVHLQDNPLSRLLMGSLLALSIIYAGDRLSRLSNAHACWAGNVLIIIGYLSALVFGRSLWYFEGLAPFSNPTLAWIAQLTVVAVATLHGAGNRTARLFALPATLIVSASTLSDALSDKSPVHLLGIETSISALSSLAGVLWLAALAWLYQRLENQAAARGKDSSREAYLTSLSYRVFHEISFLGAALLSILVPHYCGAIALAPLWWALQTPALLVLARQKSANHKHALGLGVWLFALASLLQHKQDISTTLSMIMPLTGLAMALNYRYLATSDSLALRRLGYRIYLYVSLPLFFVIPALELNAWQALPYWAAASLLLLFLAKRLQDRFVQVIAATASIFSLAVYAVHWQQWTAAPVITAVIASYGLSLFYGRLSKRGGITGSDFLASKKLCLSAREAGMLEIALAGCGYAGFLAGALILIEAPFDTIAWGVGAFAFIAFGFITGKVGHRASGLLAMGLASAKLTIVDLSGADTLMRTLVSFGAVGICCIAAGIFYLVEYGRQERKPKTEGEEKPDNS